MDKPLHPTLQRLDALARVVSEDPAALAVLGLGSAGVETERFDDHSDIDFFLVVADGAAKARYLADLGWLDGFGGTVAYAFRNTGEGAKVLFEDGLFLEWAVFTPEELAAIPAVGARLVWGRGGFELPASAAPPVPSDDTIDFHLGEALTNLFVGLHREQRGERLAATRFIQVYAVDHVLALLRLDEETSRRFPDPFEATRRVEDAESPRTPDWARLIPGYEHNVAAAAATLEWFERWYEPAPAIVRAVRSLLA